MATDNSDYNLPRTKLHELLPEPYLSDVNRSVFENLFNRFLTKAETRKVAGYAGVGNPDAIVSRQIREPTIHRQGWQLQPILYNKVGSVEHMSSWSDILNELERLGVDISRLPEWGETQVFNWVPPIDIDKLIHFQDYFWVDSTDPASQPQYLTIRSRCETATAAANFHQRLVDEFGLSFPISNIGVVDTTPPSFTIQAIVTAGPFPYIRVAGDATTEIGSSDFFNITGTATNNGEYQVLTPPIYTPGTDSTDVFVDLGVLSSDEFIGTLNTQRFDKLVIPGEYIRLLEPGFIFFFKNSNNVKINDSFLTVVEADYDAIADVTTIKVDLVFTSTGSIGDISLEEQLNIFLAERDCQCTGSVGWDIFGWDDNPNAPLWDGDLVPLLSSISNAGPPTGTPADGTLWFDTVANQLHQYSLATGWKLLYNNFQTVVDATEGLALWDFTPGCGQTSIIEAADQWIEQNHWVHKTDVVNFSIAKQASLPIIEFDWDLELNEWTLTNHTWAYRKENFNAFAEVTYEPSLIELTPFVNWSLPTVSEIVLNEQYGDQTDWFIPGSFFQTTDSSEILEVVSSKYEQDVSTQPFKTKITVTVDVTTTPLVPGVSPIRPFRTSRGDPWKNYHDHWLHVRAETTIATNHQDLNPFVEVPISPVFALIDFSDPTLTPGGGTDGEYVTTPYSQTYTIQTLSTLTTFYFDTTIPLGWDRALDRRSLAGRDDIRVYINDIRSFGTYEEIIDTEFGVIDPVTTISEDVDYVVGITFLAGFEPQQFDSVRVEVGEASIKEFGNYSVPVRTIESNEDFENLLTGGVRTISLVKCRQAEQVKTDVNQYPLFDIYNSDGTSANIANSIFAFQTSPTAPVAGAVGLRLVVDDTGTNYSFEQFLCDPDTNALWAYRDYSNEPALYWVNTETNEVNFWTGFTWSSKVLQGDQYTNATLDIFEPAAPFTGQIWLDTFNQVLNEYDGATFNPIASANINALNYDITLQTIWRKGLNDETYTPSLVDWKNRTEAEYDAEMSAFVDTKVTELRQADPSLTIAQATTQATTLWFADQADPLSLTGVWVGDWEVPDPLYYNNQHENRKVLTSSELLSHFNSIIASQPDLPGFNGPDSARFHLIPTENVNYGVGGTIHEYNNAWDTFLSSVFVNNVTPPTLYEHAHDQYESLLNFLKESFRDDSIQLLTTTSTESLIDFTSFARDVVLTNFEQNDNAAFLYGDSTTFTEVIGGPDLGIRNWIATLPYLNLVEPRDPELIIDAAQGINQVVHHDGHRHQYAFAPAVADGIARLAINQVDPRSGLASPNNTFGQLSSVLPPNDISEFITEFGESPNGRPGVYWYVLAGQNRTLYRLTVAAVSVTEPSVSLADGTLWMDMSPGLEVLRVKSGASWGVVPGLVAGDGRFHNGTAPADVTTSTISAWQVFDLDAILGGIILEAEERLFGNVPVTTTRDYDFASLQDTAAKTALYNDLLEAQFFAFTRQSEIPAPLINGDFDQTNPFTWNYKRSTPGIGFEILAADEATKTFTVDGDQTGSFPGPLTSFFVKNSGGNDGTFTATGSVFGATTTVITVVEDVVDSIIGAIYKGTLPTPENTGAESGGDWRDYYNKLYGTPYPHLEPWKLQRYVDKPTWWDAEYKNDDPVTYGARRWKYIHSTTTGMWESLRLGIVPVGQLLPDGVTLSTGLGGETTLWSYFSVNISDGVVTADGGTTNFAPDDVFPPLWDYLAAGEPAITNNRSVFQSFSVEIVSPAADYSFADAGPVEFDWRVSSQFLYDQLTVAFQMDPVMFTASAFGFEYDVIDRLEIDERTDQTPCHCRTEWHGEVVDNDLFQVNGLNQWYVNYNRFLGFDTSLSDFRSLWTLWTAPMMYQFSSFVDSTSLQVAHRTVPTSEFDHRLASKRSPAADDFWLDAFDVRLLGIPPNLARFDNQLNWQLEIDTNSPLNRTIEHYDVHNYQFSVDPSTDICTLYSYPMQSLDFFNETFSVQGDQTIIFPFGREFDIVGSVGNNGTYTVVSSVYDATVDLTIIQIGEAIPSPVPGGNIVANYRSVPWESGDSIWFSSEETLPAPLKSDQPGIGPTRYFVIKLSESTFQVANTQQNALSGLPIDITTSGRKNSFVGEIQTTFFALAKAHTDTLWRHFKIDKTNTLSFTPPNDIRGMQTLINIVDGYDSFTHDEGFRTNDLNQQIDPDSGRFVDWGLELERFIDFAYTQRLTRNRNINNRYAVSVDDAANTFTFTAEKPGFATGTAVNVLASNTILPSPIIMNLKYYIVVVNDTDFQLATTRQNAFSGITVDLLPTTGLGDIDVTAATDFRLALPSQEINPFRNALFFRPAAGIVSNLITGPSEDIRNTQLLFDQYGRPLNRKQMRILREDEQTQVIVIDEIPNDVELTSIFNDPYNYLHLGGAHLFVDTYEHVLIFNDYTTEDNLLYDTFLGLNVTKFELLFNRQVDFTQRPNVGGSYFKTFFNQGAELLDNFESSVEGLRNLYDSYRVIESKPAVRQARKALGYEGTRDYLDNMNLNEKSQFLFWRGLIQTKGSIQSVKAFINSRRFIDAKVDEFWAYKIADFGSVEDKEYPEMFLTTLDARTSDLRLQFIEEGDFCVPGFGEGGFDDPLCGFDLGLDDAITVDEGFTPIIMTDQARWFNQPDQLAILRNNGLAFYFDLKTENRLPIIKSATIPTGLNPGDGWIDTSLDPDFTFRTFDPEVTRLQPQQTEADYAGAFVGGDGLGASSYIIGEIITLANGGTILVNSIDASGDVATFLVITTGTNATIGVAIAQVSSTGIGEGFSVTPNSNNVTIQVLIPNQTENDFDGVDDNGTFFEGFATNTAYVALDTISLSNGAIIRVDSVDGSDDVITFTVITSGVPVSLNALLPQVSTSGLGQGFDLTPDQGNLSGLVTTPQSEASFNGISSNGSFTSGVITLDTTQDETDYDGVGDNGTFDPGLPELALQTDTSYTGVGSFGTFVGGIFHAVGNVLTMSNGATISVTGVTGGFFGGTVTSFTILTVGSAITTAALTQVSTTGGGFAFSLTPALANNAQAYAPGEIITLATGATVTVGTIDGVGNVDTFDITTAGSALASLPFPGNIQASSTGSGEGFVLNHDLNNATHYETGDTITLDDGVVISVTASPFGKVTEFDVTAGGLNVIPTVALLQVSTTGAGTGFTLTPNGVNLTNLTMIAGQTHTRYDNTPTTDGVFTGGDGPAGVYGVLDILTLSNGATLTVDAVAGAGVVSEFTINTPGTTAANPGVILSQTASTGAGSGFTLTPELNNSTVATLQVSQNETDYNGVGSNGSFVTGDGTGTNYAVSDIIVLSNGAVIIVDTVDGVNGDVTAFTVTQPGTPISLGDTLTQSTTSGTGTGFTLTPAASNIMNFVDNGAWNSTTGFPTFRHNFASDNEVVLVETNPVGTKNTIISFTRSGPVIPGSTVGFADGEKAVFLPTEYIPFTKHIRVFKNGTELDELVEYVQTVDGLGGLGSNQIVLVDKLSENDVVDVVYSAATLTLDYYERVNSNTIRLLTNELSEKSINISIWGQLVNEDAQTPAKIIDRAAGVVVSPVQIWDPARNFQYQTALPTVQLEMASDPAVYTDTIETDQMPPGSSVRPYILYNDPWNITEVGTTWLDTANLDYKAYYDEQANPDLDTRLRFWGQLADWGELKIYEWVESDVPPDQYDAIAETEEGNRDIPEHVRKAGRARLSPFESLDAGTTWIPLKNKYQEFDAVIEGVLGLPNEYDFTLNITTNNIEPGDIINVYINGRLTDEGVTATPVMTVSNLNEADRVRFVKPIPDAATIEADPDMQEVYEFTEVPDFDEFGIQTLKYYFWVGEKGTRNKTQLISPRDAQIQLITIPSPYMITQKALPADVRTNGVLVDLDREWIHIINNDDLAYFDKISKQLILVGSSIKAQDIANIDAFVNNVQLASGSEYTLDTTGREVEIDVEWLTARQTQVNYIGGLPNGTFSPGSGYADGDTITLSDGSLLVVVAQTAGVIDDFEITNAAGVDVVLGVALTQTASSGAGGGFTLTPEEPNVGLGATDTVRFSYVTEIPTEVFHFPDRHTQAVIRGLRGLVTSDRRFTLRYTRDFTLRDNLENGSSPLELKQAHEEWQLIRQEQPFLIPRGLWDKITESMVGYLLIDANTRVPSLERELYDSTYGTDTRFGLRDDQAFTDGATALQTILGDLQDPENDFPSVDINTFFTTHSFDTNEGIIDAMNALYETFTFTDVNRIYFAVVHDAFSFKQEYPDIFKTSMVAIHGIRPFQVAGLFDD